MRRDTLEAQGCHEWLNYLKSRLKKNISEGLASDEEVRQTAELMKRDFADASKRGRKLGTILVNLSPHQVIELLAEGKVESAATWIRHHPEIQYVSRDRGEDGQPLLVLE